MATSIPIEKVMAKFGGRPAAAAALGITPQAIQKWMDKGRVPFDRVLQVERLTGIPRHELRPDLKDWFGSAPSDGEAA